MDKFTIGDFVKELNRDSRKLFEFIYKTFYPSVKIFILKNKGNEQDAKDVFQEGVMAVIKNVEDKKADPDLPFINYLYSICRYIWMRNFQTKNTMILNEEDITESYSLDEEDINSTDESIESGIYQNNFTKLGKKCQDLLKLTLEKIPAKEIAKKFGFKSEGFVFKRKHQCKEQLMRLIKEDPEYQSYMNNKKK